MISAGLTKAQRKAIYKRDGYRCALCDSTKYLQIHHVIKRSHGGTNHPHNLITLCADCHALAHGTNLNGWDATQMDVEQAIVEYLSDYYAENADNPGQLWNPWNMTFQSAKAHGLNPRAGVWRMGIEDMLDFLEGGGAK